jgi:hypothetical protein
MTDRPFITTGTVIVFRPELPGSDDDGEIVIDTDGSIGKALKNFSSFFDSSASCCLIHPTVPFLALTKYHLAPSPTKVSAKGEISSPLSKVAATVEDSSGAVNSCISFLIVREFSTVAARKCLPTAKNTKVVRITARSFVVPPPESAFEQAKKLFIAIRSAPYEPERGRIFLFSCIVFASRYPVPPRHAPYCHWSGEAHPR